MVHVLIIGDDPGIRTAVTEHCRPAVTPWTAPPTV